MRSDKKSCIQVDLDQDEKRSGQEVQFMPKQAMVQHAGPQGHYSESKDQTRVSMLHEPPC